MKYRVRREGVELGSFPLEELRRRREAGELTGREYIQAQGRSNWQPLDLFLQFGEQLAQPSPQRSSGAPSSSPAAVWAVVAISALVFAGFIAFVGYRAVRLVNRLNPGKSVARAQSGAAREEAMAVARRPVHWTTNTQTAATIKLAETEFARRQWPDAYREHGRHDAPWDGLAVRMLDLWLANGYGDRSESNAALVTQLTDELARQTNCDDPLALTVAGTSSIELFEKVRRLERAMKAFDKSSYRAYPKFVAAAQLSGEMGDEPARQKSWDAAAVESLGQALKDGSILPRDQPLIAEKLVFGWARDFFERNHAAVGQVVHDAGTNYLWLELVLAGDGHIKEAWKARGRGYADSVTTQRFAGFNSNLAAARKELTQAWELNPEEPLAPTLMMTVALGGTGIGEMRTWFDRAVGAQIDYREAWREMRWGLRSRWHGDEASMLAFGVTAVQTGRFDTDVPHGLIESIADIEADEELDPGDHLYSRDDVWPWLQKMYEGYIAEPSKASTRDHWRGSYAATAYFAGKYDVAREQYEALKWDPPPSILTGWQAECSLMPLEVAARTGPAPSKIDRAEMRRAEGDTSQSLSLYRELENATNLDSRTLEFVHCRIASLEVEQRLAKGEWVDFQPRDDHDPNWVFTRGTAHVLPDGALEVASGPAGHFLYLRVRVGPEFEVKGQFEVVRSSTKSFQAGLVMGLPEATGREWNSFRMKRNQDEGQIGKFSRGWGKAGISGAARLNDVTNTFEFRLRDSQPTATVNGEPVFSGGQLDRALQVPDDSFLLGLGAFNDVNDTVIRYRHLQVRQLPQTLRPPPKPKHN